MSRKGKSIETGFPGGSVVKNPPANARNMGLIPGSGRRKIPSPGRSLEKTIATYSSILTWEIPGTEDPSGL